MEVLLLEAELCVLQLIHKLVVTTAENLKYVSLADEQPVDSEKTVTLEE